MAKKEIIFCKSETESFGFNYVFSFRQNKMLEANV